MLRAKTFVHFIPEALKRDLSPISKRGREIPHLVLKKLCVISWVLHNEVLGELRANQPLPNPVLLWLCPAALRKRGKERRINSTHAAA